MTRIEAEKLAKELNEKDPQWFCPLIKDNCRSDCVNFMSAFVTEKEPKKGMLHDVKDDNFEVDGFVCTCASFIGDVLVPSDI